MPSSLVRYLPYVALLYLAWPPIAGSAEPPADLVLRGGYVLSMDPQSSGTAVACRGDRIVAVGSDDQLQEMIGPETFVIELQGRTVMPGFIEGHGHFLSLGRALMVIDLSSAADWNAVVARVAAAAAETPPGQWIVGRGWHQGKWSELPAPHVRGYPLHGQLSRVTPRHPVLLEHGTGHMVLANALAMQLAGIGAGPVEVPGGEVFRDAAGEPTGVFSENAMSLVYDAYARAERTRSQEELLEDRRQAAQLANQHCLRLGVTSFQDAGASFGDVDLFRDMITSDELHVRMWLMLDEPNAALAQYLPRYRAVGDHDHRLTVRAIKRMFDGALGTHGAWLLQPYDDAPGSTGHNTLSTSQLQETIRLALLHQMQLCVHAIGDRANREVLDLFQQAGITRSRDLRWRIEHAQHIDSADFPRFAELGVIASMQANHCTSDAPFVIQRLGERRARTGAYAWRSLLDHGAVVINGTDAPVESLNPMSSLYAAVTRKLPNGVAFFPEQCMTRQEALESYTRAAAMAAFEEDQKGTVTPGKLADLIVLSQNLATVSEDELQKTQVQITIIGGRVRWQQEELPSAAGDQKPRESLN